MSDMATEAALLAAIALGAMLFFSFVVAPLIFLRLPTKAAAGLIGDLFPVYYISLAAVTIGSAVLAGLRYEAAMIWIVAMLFVLARFVLIPAIEKARSGGEKSSRFRLLHRASVGINLVQIILLAVAALGLAH
ncbi:MAG: DUF4149 domain-containing protein [Hyphomicrobiales bacterium]